MPRTSVIDFVKEKKLVEQIIMTNWNPLACEPVKFKTYLAEPTTLVLGNEGPTFLNVELAWFGSVPRIASAPRQTTHLFEGY